MHLASVTSRVLIPVRDQESAAARPTQIFDASLGSAARLNSLIGLDKKLSREYCKAWVTIPIDPVPPASVLAFLLSRDRFRAVAVLFAILTKHTSFASIWPQQVL